MKISITDVTEMKGGSYCVAGWDIEAKRMVRPLPDGHNWSAALLNQCGVGVGTLIEATPRGVSNGTYPHSTEDTPIDVTSIRLLTASYSGVLGSASPFVEADLSSGFGGNLRWNTEWNGVKQGVHVPPGTICKSLVGIRIPAANLAFKEAFGKLRVVLDDGADQYELKVSSKILMEVWRNGGIAAVRLSLPSGRDLHVRVGLARQYGNPPKCYAMLNGAL